MLNSGRCRHCKAKVHWRYPAIELATAAMFLAVFIVFGISTATLWLLSLSVCLMVLIVIDFEHKIIPDLLQLIMAALGVGYHFDTGGVHIADMLAGGVIGCVFGVLLQQGFKHVRGKDGLGTGDVKFFGVAGIWLGPLGLIPFFFYGGILGVVTATAWNKMGREAAFPFGPALAMSLYMLLVMPITAEAFWNWPMWLISHA
jgi:prepilin signal peptidase PulO-like enzyme (type II secretory pathway)